jgi:hypothetical protein
MPIKIYGATGGKKDEIRYSPAERKGAKPKVISG